MHQAQPPPQLPGKLGRFHSSVMVIQLPSRISNPFGILQNMIARGFARYGLCVARYPHAFIVIPVLLTAFLATGLLRITVQDDLRFLYSPVHSQSRVEYRVHREFTGDSINSTFIALAVESAPDDDANLPTPAPASSLGLLQRSRAVEILNLNAFILNNLTITLADRIYSFGDDICPRIALCPLSNAIVEMFFDSYYSGQLRTDPRVRLNYPIMEFYDNRFFLPTHLYGVTLSNATTKNEIVGINMVHLLYQIPGTDHDTAEVVGSAFESSLADHIVQHVRRLSVSMFSLGILKHEMSKNATYTFPFISLTVLFLVTFTIVSCMTGDWITSKPIEALMGVLTSTFAIISAAGLMFYCGVPFVSQVTVMPFLALAIGVDDTYVLLGAWQDSNRRHSPERRLAATLQEAGSAITVTSITSILSFGIGALSTTPAISIFCKFIATAIAFDYLYQVTIFAAITALGGRREAAGYHCIFIWRKMPQDQIDAIRKADYTSVTQHFFGKTLAPFLCKRATRIVVLAIYIVYLVVSIYGCSLLRPNLTPSRLLVDDSPLRHYLQLAESKIWSEGVVGRVYVNRAPDFSESPERIDEFMGFVEALESTDYSMGANSTQLWLRDFVNYWQYFSDDNSKFYDALRGFLRVSFNSQWAPFLRWNANRTRVDKFYFTTAFRIENWNVRTALLLRWRNITATHHRYEAVVFDENNFYSDQLLELQATALSSLGTAIVAMIAICVLFIGNSVVVFWVVFTMLSMDIGIAGFLSLWGADLDPTTVVNILMSIGLCIDFSTHVGYRIYRSDKTDPNERLEDAMAAIGWPVMQGGISTLLAIVVMMFVPSHVVRMFARTSILVVCTGLFHGVILLPVFIRTFTSSAGGAANAIDTADDNKCTARVAPESTSPAPSSQLSSLPSAVSVDDLVK